MGFPDSDAFGEGSESGGFGWIPSSPAWAAYSNFLANFTACLGSLTLSQWIPSRTHSVEGQIRVDLGGSSDPELESASPDPAGRHGVRRRVGGGGRHGDRRQVYVQTGAPGRGSQSSTFQLNVSAFCGIHTSTFPLDVSCFGGLCWGVFRKSVTG
jgi:hypothetical protein